MVSAIITTYNRDTFYIERSLNSIINQTYQDIEIIVVDDNSSDFEKQEEIIKLIERYKKNENKIIKYIKHNENRGACAARNTGIKYSEGEYIAFLDDDDEWLPNKIEEQISCLTDKINLVYCDWYIVKKQKKIKKKTKSLTGKAFDELLCENFIGSTSFPLIKKDILIRLEGFDETLESSQDYDMWLRISQISEITHINKPLVNYYFHDEEQITHNPRKRINGLKTLYEKYKVFYSHNKKAYSNWASNIAPNYALNGNFIKAIIYCCLMIKGCPTDIKKNLNCFVHTLYYYLVYITRQ